MTHSRIVPCRRGSWLNTFYTTANTPGGEAAIGALTLAVLPYIVGGLSVGQCLSSADIASSSGGCASAFPDGAKYVALSSKAPGDATVSAIAGLEPTVHGNQL